MPQNYKKNAEHCYSALKIQSMKKRLFVFTNFHIAITRGDVEPTSLTFAEMPMSADAIRVKEAFEGDVAVRRA